MSQPRRRALTSRLPARGRRQAIGLAALLAPLLACGDAPGEAPGVRTDPGRIPAVVVPRRDPASDYLDAIDRVEGEYGPYATELSDLYLGLGQTMLERLEYEQARDAFSRGLMVMRVNEGPKSPQQTDYLYLLANVEALLGNTETADDILANIYLVNVEHYGADSLDLLPVIERILQWYLATRPPGSQLAAYEDYVRGIGMMHKIVVINETHYGPAHRETAAAYRRLGEAQFLTVRYMLDQGIEFTLDSRMDMLSRTIDTEGGVRVSIGDHYYAGRSAFRKYLAAIEADPSQTPPDYAQAYANLGDWYLSIGKFRNACKHYEQAYRVLAESEGYAELAEGYMAQPRPVHFFQPPPDFLGDTEVTLPELHLDISMTVTRSGDVLAPEVLNAPGDLPAEILGDILRLLRETPFRPAMKAGDPVTTKDFIWQFAILPRPNAS